MRPGRIRIACGQNNDVEPFSSELQCSCGSSDAAADVSGQAFIVLSDQVHRMQPAVIAASVVAGATRWTVEGLIAAKDELFAGTSSGVPVWGGPPM